MTQSQLRDVTAGTPMGSRANFWFDEKPNSPPGYGDDADRDRGPEADDRQGQGTEWGTAHDFREGKSREEVVAHRLLRQSGTAMCATTAFHPPDRREQVLCAWLFDGLGTAHAIEHDEWALHHRNEEVELTEPCWTVAKDVPQGFADSEYGQYRHRSRLNKEAGYVTGGETTAVYIADRPLQDFLTVVSEACRLYNVRAEEAIQLLRFATKAKRAGDQRDVDILEEVICRITVD